MPGGVRGGNREEPPYSIFFIRPNNGELHALNKRLGKQRRIMLTAYLRAVAHKRGNLV